MKLHTKLLIASFLPVVFFICMAGGISYFLTQRALVERSMHWLETRLSEAIQVTKKRRYSS